LARQGMISSMHDTTSEFPLLGSKCTVTLDRLLQSMARRYPERIAIDDAGSRMDYGSLAAVAGLVARRLLENGGGPGACVGLIGPRSILLFAAMHGIYAAGSAAAVISPTWPAEYIRRRLRGIKADCVLTVGMRFDDAPCPIIRLPSELAMADAGEAGARERPCATAPRDTAYISFTSGSTGDGKAVAVSHRNVVHYTSSLAANLGLSEQEPLCFAHVTTLSADLGHTAWTGALATGGRLLIVSDDDARDPARFFAALDDAKVDFLKTTPSHFAALLPGRPTRARRLHTLILGGERFPSALARRCLDEGVADRVVNSYGPTETTISACHYIVRSQADIPDGADTLPIGMPMVRGRRTATC
jgi:non-ribosomal peptide synthetase component F